MDYEQNKLEYEGKVELAKETEKFLKNAIHDMKESAKAQHEIDKANFAKVKEESKAQFEAAKHTGAKDIQVKVAKDIEDIKAKTAASIEAAKPKLK